MKERAAWIEMLFKRGHGLDAFSTRFLLDCHRKFIGEQVAQDPEDGAALRLAALDALGMHDAKTIIQGLAFLFVVGNSGDLPSIERFMMHPNEKVQRAARACRFELRKRAK